MASPDTSMEFWSPGMEFAQPCDQPDLPVIRAASERWISPAEIAGYQQRIEALREFRETGVPTAPEPEVLSVDSYR